MGTLLGFLPYLKHVLFIEVSNIKTRALKIKLETTEIDFRFKFKLRLKFIKLFVESFFTFLL